MTGHGPTRCYRLLFILALAIALAPVVAEAQNYAFASCISRSSTSNSVLKAPAAMNVGVRPAAQGHRLKELRYGETDRNSGLPTDTRC